MTDDLWDIIINVHLRGTYLVTKAAYDQMIEQGHGGRIIMTSSTSGLLGNFGQTNYGAAKAATAGFMRCLWLEGVKYGITVNILAPTAMSRLTEDILPEQAKDAFPPEKVSPAVVWLCTDEAKEVSGRQFLVAGNNVSLLSWQITPIASKDQKDAPWGVKTIGEKILASKDELAADQSDARLHLADMPGPLAGFSVLDLSAIVSGPLTAALLADQGASVIKVERLVGDIQRHVGSSRNGFSGFFHVINRGKRSIALDLGTEEGRGIVERLAQRADVVIQNFRPGVIGRLGLGYERLSALNPKLVYLSISGSVKPGRAPASGPTIRSSSSIPASPPRRAAFISNIRISPNR